MTNAGQKRSWLFTAACGATVVLVSALGPSPRALPAPDPTDERALFDALTSTEAVQREKAQEDWAHHPWSQQDAFGSLEKDRARDVGRDHQASTQLVFRALDDGMRAGWRTPDGGVVRTGITPLRQRPMD